MDQAPTEVTLRFSLRLLLCAIFWIGFGLGLVRLCGYAALIPLATLWYFLPLGEQRSKPFEMLQHVLVILTILLGLSLTLSS